MAARIRIKFGVTGGTQVWVNDHEVHGIKEIVLRHHVEDLPSVQLTLLGAVEIDGEVLGETLIRAIPLQPGVIDVTTHEDMLTHGRFRRWMNVP